MSKIFNQSGIIHTLPLLVIVAAVGVISFLLVSSTLPLNGLFGILNQKPSSNAQTMMGSPFLNNNCTSPAVNGGLTNQAFCDTFDAPFGAGGNTGQLDPNKWMVSRLSGLSGAGQGMLDGFVPSHAMRCKNEVIGVFPDNDYFMCGAEFGESEHFMEAFDAAAQYIFNDEMITQPIDFANRTGTIIWDVDNGNSGGHGWWTEFWITDQPISGPHFNTFLFHPRNGFGISFDGTCGAQPIVGSDAGAALGGVAGTNIFRNGVGGGVVPWEVSLGVTTIQSGPGPTDSCYKTAPDSLNHMKLLINKDRIEVWATDNGDDTFNYKLKTVFTGLNLQFTRGYIHFQHAAYNPDKAVTGGVTQFKTYHWDTIGFDGPVIPADAHYAFPSSLSPCCYGGTSVGYNAGGPNGFVNGPISVGNVNLAGAQSAYLTFNSFIDNTTSINFSLNNGPWHTYNDPNNPYEAAVVPVSLSELKNGTNTVNFKGTYWDGPIVANINLFVTGAPKPWYVNFDQTLKTTMITAPATIPLNLSVTPQAPATSISKIVLTQGGQTLATLTSAPYTFNWTNVPIGTYLITATATDNLGNVGTGSIRLNVISPLPLFVESYLKPAIYVSNVTPTTATINWTTDKTSDSQVEFGPTTAYGSSTTVDSSQTITHTVNLTGITPFQTYHFRVKSRNAAGLSSSGDQTFQTPLISNVPAPWVNRDIGSVNLMGGAKLTSGVFTLQASGEDIWNGADTFQYAYQSMNGDGSIVARVTSVSNSSSWAKAGVMIRETTDAGSKNVFMLVSQGNGLVLQSRDPTNGGTGSAGTASGAAPYFVKLVRQGNTFTGFSSPDGTTWTPVGTATVSMNSTVNIGLALDAFNQSVLNTSTFDNVSISGSTVTPTSLPSTAPTPSPTPIPTPTRTPVPTPTPASGVESAFNGPHALPGTLQLEDYDNGGEGVAYHDNESQNQGGSYRTSEGVDIQSTTDTGGGFLVGWTQAGEWLKYMVNVTASGTYNLGFRVSSQGTGGTFHLEVDGTNVTGPVTVADTGGWGSFTTLTKSGVSLTGGAHTLRLVMDSNGPSNFIANFNYITLTQTSGSTPPPPSCPKANLGDTDCNGVIDIQDYNNVFTDFGKSGSNILGDVDKNQIVDIQDYNLVFTNFGK